MTEANLIHFVDAQRSLRKTPLVQRAAVDASLGLVLPSRNTPSTANMNIFYRSRR